MSVSPTFPERLRQRSLAVGSLAAAGLDPDFSLIPEAFLKRFRTEDKGIIVEAFCKEIIAATAEYVCAYKVQPAFFSRFGADGERALKAVMSFLHTSYPQIPVIMDGKISDITNTVMQYVQKVFDDLGAHAVLVNPLMGSDTVRPFIERQEKGVFVLCKTSNPSSVDILDLPLANGNVLWREIMRLSLEVWNENGNIGLVLSANSPADVFNVRAQIGDAPVLLAGVGAQGGDLRSTVSHVVDRHGAGFFVPSSRGIMFASPLSRETFTDASARAARELRDSINDCLPSK